jgi:hypothetical protein
MKILVLNQDWFVPELRARGHEVLTCGASGHLDLKLSAPFLHIDTLLRTLEPTFQPDVLLVLDNSSPVMLAGLDELKIPSVFYSVDTHHHAHLHKYLAFVFDKVLVAQKDYMGPFQQLGLEPEWMPLWASRRVDASTNKKHGAVFVGTLNPALNPERVEFFDRLQKLAPMLCTSGDWAQIFPFSELVINQTVKSDLNFRVFEAMMCGPLLLTEKGGNGLFEIFKDGEHLLAYERGNAEQAAEIIRHCLADLSYTRRIAQAGRDEVLAHHTEAHRAARIEEILISTKLSPSRLRHFGAMTNHVSLGRTLSIVDTGLGMRAFGLALKSAEQGLRAGETMSQELACYFIFAALRFDTLAKSCVGDSLLHAMQEAHQEIALLGMASMRNHLNLGRRAQAEAVAIQLGADNLSNAYEQAELIVQQLLRIDSPIVQ